jgi:hypothetical protein
MIRNIPEYNRLGWIWWQLRKPHVQRTLALGIAAILSALLGLYCLGSSPAAHADSTCIGGSENIPISCDEQDPIQQQCVNDAQTPQTIPAMYQGTLIGEVDMRFSPTCQTYWIRTIAYSSALDMVYRVEAQICCFLDQTQQNDVGNHIWPEDGSRTVWTQMTTTKPRFASGIFDLANHLQIIQLNF